MACLLISGRSEPCKDSLGGLKAAYFINYRENAFTIAAGEATAINVAITDVFKYELRADGNTFSQATVSDKNAGTTVTTQTITLALKKLDKDSSLQVDLMAKGRPVIVIQDRNNNYFLVGTSEGCDLTGSDINSGGARADFNGYNLTFESQEGSLAPFLDAATVTAMDLLVSATNITP
tara:strand:+ start:1365 stop:1898 length:534 start_codon:yes stop_codon:yes gene_type:complete